VIAGAFAVHAVKTCAEERSRWMASSERHGYHAREAPDFSSWEDVLSKRSASRMRDGGEPMALGARHPPVAADDFGRL
jgi:hypothetical protein